MLDTPPESPAPPSPAPKWDGRSRGGAFGHWFFIALLKTLGPGAAYVMLVPVVLYFMVFSPRGVKASSEFLQRLWGPIPLWRRVPMIYRHFFNFGLSLVDRVAVVGGGGKGFTFVSEGRENLVPVLEEGHGAILLGAHMGVSEVAGHMLRGVSRTLNVVALENDAEAVRRALERAMKGRPYRVIPIDAQFTQIVEILAALRRGEIVAMHGDRHLGGRAARATFLGREAAFPFGPYLLSAISGAPLIPVFAMREPRRAFRFFAFPPMRLSMPPRAEREAFFARCAADYAARLETMARRYPYQWFNLYPFWDAPTE